ncbi:hypothetical protein PSPO_b1695 [Pseudoalteromonas spongiae UST010723-006]|nr:hypothetical protein PSPO_b1695 [Pseudoalteromonas spongiae UST010723-006]
MSCTGCCASGDKYKKDAQVLAGQIQSLSQHSTSQQSSLSSLPLDVASICELIV